MIKKVSKGEEHMSETKEILNKLVGKLENPNELAGLDGVYEFHITGEDTTTFHLTVHQGQGKIEQGEHGTPDITLSATAKNLLALLNGQLNPTMSFITGKLKIKGDMALALKLQDLLK